MWLNDPCRRSVEIVQTLVGLCLRYDESLPPVRTTSWPELGFGQLKSPDELGKLYLGLETQNP
jgi:hypothetical protein